MENVIKALEVICKVHENSGRHEINRTDLEKAIALLKAGESNGKAATVDSVKVLDLF